MIGGTLNCTDSFSDTIVSIQDNPFARLQGPLSDAKVKPVLGVVRSNVHFIFSGVSKQQAGSPGRGALGTIRVRNFSDSGSEQESIKQEDGPSLLLYYLFDDWALSYGLIAKREHKYGVWLDELVSTTLLTLQAGGLISDRGKIC